MTIARDVCDAIEESSYVYLTVGLKYNLAVWREQWPKIMANAIDACKAKKARLIFFDNVYMYGRVDGPMTEETPVNPCSRKGEIRARIADQLLTEVAKGNLRAKIARSADFYGPSADKSSLPYIFIFSRLAKGKKAKVLINAMANHSYTFTADCVKALYLLAKDDGIDPLWHLPTARPALNSAEFIAMAAKVLETKPEYTIMKQWMIRIAGLFSREISEVYEMLYQNAFPYEFDSTKFERHFNFEPTPYETGIAASIQGITGHLKSGG